MSLYHLAQINIGRLIAPVGASQVAEFVNQLEPINAIADRAAGFIWRLQSSSGNATDIVYNDDPSMLVNMSVWESLEALRDYVASGKQARMYQAGSSEMFGASPPPQDIEMCSTARPPSAGAWRRTVRASSKIATSNVSSR